MASENPLSALQEAAQAGDIAAIERLCKKPENNLNLLGEVDMHSLLKTCLEQKIHVAAFSFLLDGDPEKEASLLRLALWNGEGNMAWMIMNQWQSVIETLDLSNCGLDGIPSLPSRHCQTLQEINLSGNFIETLHLSPSKFPALKHVDLEGNPLSAYPPKCRESWPRMKEYLERLNLLETRGIFKKLILLGDPDSRKQALWKELHKKYLRPTSTTKLSLSASWAVSNLTSSSEDSDRETLDQGTLSEVIIQPPEEEIKSGGRNMIARRMRSESGGPSSEKQVDHKGVTKTVTLNVWQMNYPDTAVRNFFITSRALYVVCIDLNASPSVQEASVAYWLQMIQSLTRSSSSDVSGTGELAAPIFLVGTGLDTKKHCEDTMRGIKRRMNTLASKVACHSLQGFFGVSTKSGKGLPALVSAIHTFILRQAEVRSGVSQKWILLNDSLHRMRATTPYLNWSHYEELSQKCEIKKSVLPSCTSFLRDIGCLLSFQTSAGDTEPIVILQPQWLYETLQCILDSPGEHQETGLLNASQVPVLLQGQPTYIQDFAIHLLERFNVLHLLKDGQSYLIPSLLSQPFPVKEVYRLWPPTISSHELEFQRIYQFSFLPLEFFCRVTIRLLLISGMVGDLYWRNGVLLSLSSATCTQQCMLTYNEETFTLLIRVRISTENAIITGRIGMLFRHVIEVVEILLESYYPRLVAEAKRLIPCSHCLSRSVLHPYIFSYAQCIQAITSGRDYIYCHDIPSPSRKVSLYKLAPDICLADLPHIDSRLLSMGDAIGEGGFGKILCGVLDKNPVAVKSLKIVSKDELQAFWEFQQESCMMSALQHPNIVRLYGVTSSPPRIVMELLLGDLCNHIMHPRIPEQGPHDLEVVDPSRYSWLLRMRIIYDIARGMQYIHSLKPPVIHRDLRSPNIFLVSLEETAPVCAKVADFGLSRRITSGIAGSLSTWQWLAPEVIIEDGEEYGLPSDVYSFGIVLWEILTFQFPYEELKNSSRFSRTVIDGAGNTLILLNPPDIRHAIVHEQLRPTIPKDCPGNIANLLARCWHASPSKRPTFDDIVYLLSLELGITFETTRFSCLATSEKREVSVDLASVFSAADEEENNVRGEGARNCEMATMVTTLRTGDQFVSCMDYVPHRGEVWAGTSSGTVLVMSSEYKVLDSFPAHDERITAARLVGKRMWTASADGTIRVWNLDSRTMKEELLAGEDRHPVKCLCLVSLSTTRTLVWSSVPRTKSVHVWDGVSFELLSQITVSHPVHAMVQCRDTVWLGLEEGQIMCISADSYQTLSVWSASVATVGALMAKGNRVWSGCDNGTISVWDYREEDNQIAHISSHTVHHSKISCLLHVGDMLWSGANDNNFVIWIELRNELAAIAEFTHHEGMVSDLVQVGNSVWTASNDGTVAVWRLESSDQKSTSSRLQRSQSFDSRDDHHLMQHSLLTRSASTIVAHWSPVGHSSPEALDGKKRSLGGVAQFKKRFLRTTSKRKL